MGRVKVGPQGSYWDPNDDGPNQADPSTLPQGAMPGQPPQAQAMPQPSMAFTKTGPMSPNTGFTGFKDGAGLGEQPMLQMPGMKVPGAIGTLAGASGLVPGAQGQPPAMAQGQRFATRNPFGSAMGGAIGSLSGSQMPSIFGFNPYGGRINSQFNR